MRKLSKLTEGMGAAWRRVAVAAVMVLMMMPAHADEGIFFIHGKVRDRSTSAQLVGADVFVYNQADSLLGQTKAENIMYDNGEVTKMAEFSFRLPRRKEHFKLRIAYEGHDTLDYVVDLTNMGRRELTRDLGALFLSNTRIQQLNEVTVTASKIKFYNRGDTIVYNADAFQLAEGSMLDALVKQLPGVELRDGGQIYVNGEFVESLLLNGKELFNGDNQIMLDNLGAYAVKNIEVYRRQDDLMKFVNNDRREDKALVMDVKIKKEYIGGWNINTEVGAGTDDRYLARLFAMHFTALSQVTAYANVNNLNDSRTPTGDDKWDPAERPEGTREYKEAGISYSTENESATRKINGNVRISAMHTRYNDLCNTTFFRPSGNNYEYSANNRLQHDFLLHTDHKLRITKDRIFFLFAPSYEFRYGKEWSDNVSSLFDIEQQPDTAIAKARRLLGGKALGTDRQGMINSVFNQAYSGDYHMNAGARMNFVYKVPRSDDHIDLYASYTFKNHHTGARDLYLINYGEQSLSPLARRQTRNVRPNHANAFDGSAAYSAEFPQQKLTLELCYSLKWQRQDKTSNFMLGQLASESTGDYTIGNLMGIALQRDPDNSFMSTERRLSNGLAFMAHKSFGKIGNLMLELPVEFVDNYLNYAQSQGVKHARYRRAILNRAGFGYSLNRLKGQMQSFLSVRYVYNTQTPSLSDMIDVANTTSPLNVYIGNPDLKAYGTHLLNIMYYMGRPNKTFIVNVTGNAGGGIAKGYSINESTGVRTYRSYNVSGNSSLNVTASYGTPIVNRLDGYGSISYSGSRTYDMVGINTFDMQKTRMDCNVLSSHLELKYKPISKLTFDLSYDPKWQWNKSQLSGTQPMLLREHKYGAGVTAKLPYHWSVRSSVTLYSRSGFDDKQLDTNDWIWNARISKSFSHGRWVASVDAYDLLRQMRAVTYTVNPQCRVEKFTNTIPRYVLFHLTYRINIMPKKEVVKPIEHLR